MSALSNALGRLPHLCSLQISHCAFEGGRAGPVRSHLDEASYEVLGDALRSHEQLTYLDVSRNHFIGPGFPHLAQRIAQMPSLRGLKLGQNDVDFSLWLSSEYLRPTASWIYPELLVLGSAVARNSQLKTLDLSEVCDHLSVHTVKALVRSLDAGPTVARRVSVPMALDVKLCFLLCNRHLPYHLQLPEVIQVFASDDAQGPLLKIFQYCAEPRTLLLDGLTAIERHSLRRIEGRIVG